MSIDICDQEMSTSINDLPQEITALVFQGVPFSSIGQCRAVCKEWNSLIMEPEFSCLFKADSPKPILVANDPVEGWSMRVYSSKSGLWVPVSLPFLQDAPEVGPLYLTASSGGLMCFEARDRQSFIICNPITKKWRHLQLPVKDNDFARRTCSCLNPYHCKHWELSTSGPDTLTGLIVNQEVGSYKLIIASLDQRRGRSTFIFDSLASSWTRGAQLPRGNGFVNPVALTVGQNLYCLIDLWDQRFSHEGKVVAKYDSNHDSWCCSARLDNYIVPFFDIKTELELVEFNGFVKVLARKVERFRGYQTFYDPAFQHGSEVSVLSVLEYPGSIEVNGSQWNGRNDWSDLNVKMRLMKSYIQWKSMASAYSTSFAGHGIDIYALGMVQSSSDSAGMTGMLHVLKVSPSCSRNTTPSTSQLPSFGTKDRQSQETQIELRVFEPSLSTQV